MRSYFAIIWLLATLSLAFPFGPFGDTGKFNLNFQAKRSSEFDFCRHTENNCKKRIGFPRLYERGLFTRAIADGHFTEEEWPWLYKQSLSDTSIAGLQDTTIVIKNILEKNGIPWVITGGWALVLYGEPLRNTADIDIDVETTMPELIKLLEADGRFVIPAKEWWPDESHLQAFFKNGNKYFDIDFMIAGQKNSIKPLATVTRFISTTISNAKFSLPVLQPGILFRSKAFALAYPKRTKHEQDAKDIIYLVENYYNDLGNIANSLPVEKQQFVVDYFTRYQFKFAAQLKELFHL